MEYKARKRTVAVIGTGLAGLTIAHLLHTDRQAQYDVQVFEAGHRASLDAASVSIPHPDRKCVDRVDVPMRAFSEGYYPNLKAMYDSLGISYHRQRLVFAFSADGSSSTSKPSAQSSSSTYSTYFIHASNLHVFPPTRPPHVPYLTHLYKTAIIGACFLWFIICCLLFPAQDFESLGAYLRRVRIPRSFVGKYILPLLSAICTCPHEALLQFPAQDVITYRKRIVGGRQFVVTDGVKHVERKLLSGLGVTYNARVISVTSCGLRKLVTWAQRDAENREFCLSKKFDIVVMATPPPVAASIFEPARESLTCIPSVPVRTVIHSDCEWKYRLQRSCGPAKIQGVSSGQLIFLHTDTAIGITEATHVHESGVMVSTSPLSGIDSKQNHGEHTFTRVLRTVQSQRAIDCMFKRTERKDHGWRNGDLDVWLVGAWCWDGMVLLEGCIVSAMRTANALGVEVPWE